MAEKTLTDLPRDLRIIYSKGYEAFQRENFDYAIELFNQILTKDPTIYECRQALRAAQNGKSGAKTGFFKRAFSSASASPAVAKAQLALRKSPEEAIQIAEGVLNTDANNAGAHKVIAEAALAMEMPRTAVMSLETLVRNAPDDRELSFQLADACITAGDKPKAEKVLSKLRESFPNDGEINQKLKDLSARQSMDEGGYGALADGKGSYRDVLKNKAESEQLEQEKRQIKSEDATETLLQDYLTRIKTEPNNMKLLRNLAEIYAQKNEIDTALGYYEKMTAADNGADTALQKQITDLKLKKFNIAISQLDQSAGDYPEKAAQLKADRDTFQLDECKARVEKYPTDLTMRFELGVLYFNAGKITEAIAELQKAKNNPNKQIQAMNYLAQCFAKRNMNDMAARTVQDALKLKLVFDAEKMELTYTLGSLFEKMGKKEEAIEQFKLIYEKDVGFKDVSKKVEDYYANGG